MSAGEGPELTMRTSGPAANGIALTFDDGPCERTAGILDLLDARGAKGTFFVVGRAIAGHEPMLRRMVRDGHEVANHSFQHVAYPRGADLEAVSEIIRSLTGTRPKHFRPPFGAADRATAEATARAGMTGVRWDVDSRDVFPVWRGIEPDELVANVIGAARPGSIVLMHDGCPWSSIAAALPAIVDTLQGRGHELVTVTDVLDDRGAGSRSQPPTDGSWLECLAAMRPAQVVALLEDRARPVATERPERGELVRALVERVALNPAAFSRLGERIAGLDPDLVEAALEGLRRGVNPRRRYDWPGVLSLVEAAAGMAHAEGAAEAIGLVDAAWALDALPSEHDQRAWRAVDGADAESRPAAAEALAVRSAITFAKRLAARVGDAFDLEASPVAPALDRHLDPALEAAPEVRAVYGAALSTLLALDPDWVAARVGRIFPTGVAPDALGESAWEAFVAWTDPSAETFELLEPQYRRAVMTTPGAPSPHSPAAEGATAALGRHLLGLYRLGIADLGDGGLLDELCRRRASAPLGAIVEAAGATLDRAVDSSVGDPDRRRLMELWDWLAARAADWPRPARRSLATPFGLWYASGELDGQWSDGRLVRLLRAGIRVEPEFRVLDRVARRAAIDPAAAVEAAAAWVELGPDDWRLYAVRERIATVLQRAAAAGDPQTVGRARALDRLLRGRGHPRYEELA